MGKNQKSERHPIMKSKYFKWGLTAFIVIMASVLSIYLIINVSVISKSIGSMIRMIMPVVDGFIVAYLLGPLVDLLEDKVFIPLAKKYNIELNDKKKSLMRSITIFLSLLFVFILIRLFIRTVVPQLILSIRNIINQMPVYLDSLINLSNTVIDRVGLFPGMNIVNIIENYYEDIMAFIQENIVPSINGWMKSLSSSVFGFVGALWDLLIGFFIAVYLLSGKERFRAQAKKLIYVLFKRERANRIIEDLRYIDKTFISFFIGKLIDSIIIGMICFIILTLFNMPYTLLISVIIGVTNIIPFFGPFIGAIPSAFLILLIDPIKALYFVIIVVILQQFDGNILGPIILGNSTGLSGFWVIFSITFFGGIWGIPGMFLGVPTFACIYAWLRRFMRGSLTEKDLSLDTDDYINLEYIDHNNVIHTKVTKGKISLNNEKKYTKISLSDSSEEHFAKEGNGLKESINNLIERLSKAPSQERTLKSDDIMKDEPESDENDENVDI